MEDLFRMEDLLAFNRDRAAVTLFHVKMAHAEKLWLRAFTLLETLRTRIVLNLNDQHLTFPV